MSLHARTHVARPPVLDICHAAPLGRSVHVRTFAVFPEDSTVRKLYVEAHKGAAVAAVG